MAQIEDAIRRLERAVGRLEAAAGMPGDEAERRRLTAALAEVKADYAALAEAAGMVAARLDGTIARLDAALED